MVELQETLPSYEKLNVDAANMRKGYIAMMECLLSEVTPYSVITGQQWPTCPTMRVIDFHSCAALSRMTPSDFEENLYQQSKD